MKKAEPGLKRRSFIKLGLAAGAAMSLGACLTLGGERVKDVAQVWPRDEGAFTPGVWLRIEHSGQVTVRVNHTEMGQGVTTAYAMLAAEELDADWSLVRAEVAPVESVYKNPEFNTQMTASSTSLSTGWEILRKAGATARLMLIRAAAQSWGVGEAECRTENGRVLHPASGRALDYGQLVQAAAELPVPQDAPLKAPDRFRIIGGNPERLDGALKAEGRAVFGLDVRLKGMLRAAVVHAPVLGARLVKLNKAPAMRVKGVMQVVELGSGAVAVVAETTWQAMRGAEALNITWDRNEDPAMDSQALRKRWVGLAQNSGDEVYQKGDPPEAPGGRKLTAEYFAPFQAHATPEPMNCTALVRDGVCLIWAPTQNQDAAQEIAARITGLPYAAISVETTFTGGGFGRRIAVDYVAEAVTLAQRLNAPVQVFWSREEDIRNDCFRPATHNRMEAQLDRDGMPLSWNHRIVGPDHMAHMLPKLLPSMIPYFVPRSLRDLATSAADAFLPGIIAGKKAIEGAAPLPYDIPSVRVEFIEDDPGIPLGFWRSVAHSQNAFVVECFMDELAAAAGQDPVDFRLDLLKKNPGLSRVLQLAAQKADWLTPPEPGVYRGVAAHEFHHTMLAFIAEASVSPEGLVKVHRVVCALDCGLAVHPKNIAAQMESGIAFGLTATLKSSIEFERGRARQSNFDDFQLLTMDEMPEVEVYIAPSSRPPSAIGESAVPMIAPAVCNAIHAATGVRIRELPVDPGLLAGKRSAA